jgi:hypothetical protein
MNAQPGDLIQEVLIMVELQQLSKLYDITPENESK